jgi:hypothetical protein
MDSGCHEKVVDAGILRDDGVGRPGAWPRFSVFNRAGRKNFIRFSAGWFTHRAKRSKSFLVLFFKKEPLAFLVSLACI